MPSSRQVNYVQAYKSNSEWDKLELDLSRCPGYSVPTLRELAVHANLIPRNESSSMNKKQLCAKLQSWGRTNRRGRNLGRFLSTLHQQMQNHITLHKTHESQRLRLLAEYRILRLLMCSGRAPPNRMDLWKTKYELQQKELQSSNNEIVRLQLIIDELSGKRSQSVVSDTSAAVQAQLVESKRQVVELLDNVRRNNTHVSELENIIRSHKEQLVNNTASNLAQVNELKVQIDQARRALSTVMGEKTVSEDMIVNLRRRILELEQLDASRLVAMQESYDSKFTEQESSFVSQAADAQQRHAQELIALRDRDSAQQSDIRNAAEAKIAELQTSYNTATEQQRAVYEAKLAEQQNLHVQVVDQLHAQITLKSTELSEHMGQVQTRLDQSEARRRQEVQRCNNELQQVKEERDSLKLAKDAVDHQLSVVKQRLQECNDAAIHLSMDEEQRIVNINNTRDALTARVSELQHKVDEQQRAIAVRDHEIESLRNRSIQTEANVTALEAQLHLAQKATNEASMLYTNTQNALDDLKASHTARLSDIERLNSQLLEAGTERQHGMTEIDQLQKRLLQKDERIAELDASNAMNAALLIETRTMHEASMKVANEMKVDLRQRTERIGELEKQLNDAVSKLQRQGSDLDSINSGDADLRAQIETLTAQYQETLGNLDAERGKTARRQHELEEQTGTIKGLQAKLAVVERDHQFLARQNETLLQRLQSTEGNEDRESHTHAQEIENQKQLYQQNLHNIVQERDAALLAAQAAQADAVHHKKLLEDERLSASDLGKQQAATMDTVQQELAALRAHLNDTQTQLTETETKLDSGDKVLTSLVKEMLKNDATNNMFMRVVGKLKTQNKPIPASVQALIDKRGKSAKSLITSQHKMRLRNDKTKDSAAVSPASTVAVKPTTPLVEQVAVVKDQVTDVKKQLKAERNSASERRKGLFAKWAKEDAEDKAKREKAKASQNPSVSTVRNDTSRTHQAIPLRHALADTTTDAHHIVDASTR